MNVCDRQSHRALAMKTKAKQSGALDDCTPWSSLHDCHSLPNRIAFYSLRFQLGNLGETPGNVGAGSCGGAYGRLAPGVIQWGLVSAAVEQATQKMWCPLLGHSLRGVCVCVC